MKVSLALGPRRALSRQTAWGCFTTNVAMPGFGSLVAGRVSGYPQAALMLLGLLLTVVFGIRTFAWYASNYSRLNDPQTDPLARMAEMWMVIRWAIVGIGVFALGWIWAFFTSLHILREAKKAEQKKLPPKLAP